MIKYKVKVDLVHEFDKSQLWTEYKLQDKRANQFDLKLIVELLEYVGTYRIRRNLELGFIKEFEEGCEELIAARIKEDPKEYKLQMELIYELVYIHYPEVRRKFLECLIKRRNRLDEQGRTKVEVNRAKRLKVQRAEMLGDNKAKYRTRLTDEKISRHAKLSDRFLNAFGLKVKQ
jgi:hypothetical protein